MVLAAQEGMDPAMLSVPWEAKMGKAPQGLAAAESLDETLGEQLVPLAVCSLTSCKSSGCVSLLFSLQLGEPERA